MSRPRARRIRRDPAQTFCAHRSSWYDDAYKSNTTGFAIPSTNEFPPDPIPTLSPLLLTSLRERTQAVLSHLVKTNSISTFFNEAECLADFREGVKRNDDRLDNSLETFHDNVPLTVYENYIPFVSRFFEQPCKMSSINNIMSSGFPEFIAHSSGTSAGRTKHFPKYRHPEHMSTSTTDCMKASNPVSQSGGKNCIVYSLRHFQVIQSLDEDGDVKLKMPVCTMSTGVVRMHNNMHVDGDPRLQYIRAATHSSPLAVSFISNYKSFMFMHALFALQEPKVELINTMFSTVFRDFCRIIDEQWDMLVECIDAGSIPDLESVGDLKDKLQKFLPRSPERAKELREVRGEGNVQSSPGWLAKIWPGLHVVIANQGGPFQTVVPEIRQYIGPDVELRTLGITCSETFLALAYDPRDASLYKIVGSDDVVEFLPLDVPEEAKYVAQSWNVKVGKRYEVVLTTRDGLWRYRLGDVIEVAGFDPRDGQPVIRYVERRGVYIRLASEMVTGEQLMDALHSTTESFGVASELCVAPDYRGSIPRYCFLVELQGKLGPSPTNVCRDLHAHLADHNENYLCETQSGKVAPPVVRVLRQGTFGEYRDWVVQTTGMAAGQIKVPLVIWDEGMRGWFGERVVEEFEFV